MRVLLPGIAFLALAVGANGQTPSAFTPAVPEPANATPSTAYQPSSVSATTAPPRNQPYDPLLDLPPLPSKRVALIGGTVTDVDGVLNRITIRPFGGKKEMHFSFDTRSQIEHDGTPATERDIHRGDRVYIDSMLDGVRLFAKAIRIRTLQAGGVGYGQILSYDVGSGVLTLRDELADRAVHFRLSPATSIHSGSQTRSTSDLKPGSLVSLDFGAQQGTNLVREISILAETGASFSFTGKITFVDLARNVIAINNQSDGKTYEIRLSSITPDVIAGLHEGKDVSVSAVFDGKQYAARNLSLATSAQ